MQVSQEAGKVVCYSYLMKNFPQFVVIHTVKGFGIVKKTEVDVSLELSCFFDDLTDVVNLVSGFSAFSKSSLHKLESRFLGEISVSSDMQMTPSLRQKMKS